jgi:hypothetical protein
MNQLELAGRYRFRPQLELQLVLMGGGGGGTNSDQFADAGLFVDFRYHFLVNPLVDVIAFGGLGSMAVAEKGAGKLETKGRPALRLGAGIERRFGSFALGATVFLFAVGENKEVPDPIMATTGYQLERFGVSGVAFLLGGSYYF